MSAPALKHPQTPSPSWTSGWGCGFAACSDALGRLGIAVGPQDLLAGYTALGFSRHRFGITTYHIGLLAALRGKSVVVYTSSAWLRAIARAATSSRPVAAPQSRENSDTLRACRCLLEAGGVIKLVRRDKRRIALLRAWAHGGGAAVVCVSGREYFGIDENWNHYLAVVGFDRDRGRGPTIVDRFAQHGLVRYRRWRQHLLRSERFDWTAWRGDMVLIGQPAC
jgi:hypothetical protein